MYSGMSAEAYLKSVNLKQNNLIEARHCDVSISGL